MTLPSQSYASSSSSSSSSSVSSTRVTGSKRTYSDVSSNSIAGPSDMSTGAYSSRGKMANTDSDSNTSRDTGKEKTRPSIYSPNFNIPGSENSRIFVSPRQKGNKLLEYIKDVRWEYSPDILSDFYVPPITSSSSSSSSSTSSSTMINILYLSLKYHGIHPEYIFNRMKKLGTSPQTNYVVPASGSKYLSSTSGSKNINHLRIILAIVDIDSPKDRLTELTKLTFVYDYTLYLAWSNKEAASIISQLRNVQLQAAVMAKAEAKEAATAPTRPSSSSSSSSSDPKSTTTLKSVPVMTSETAAFLGNLPPLNESILLQEPKKTSNLNSDDSQEQEQDQDQDQDQASTSSPTSTSQLTIEEQTEALVPYLIDTTTKLRNGITSANARSLLVEYGSLSAAILDGGDRLEEITGWGDRKTQKFKELVTKPFFKESEIIKMKQKEKGKIRTNTNTINTTISNSLNLSNKENNNNNYNDEDDSQDSQQLETDDLDDYDEILFGENEEDYY